MPQLDQLRVLVAVADAGSFAAAARILECSPAAVSRTVAALEGELGARLIDRTTRALSFTGAGERFLVQARQILAAMDVAVSEVSDEHASLSGEVGITAPLMFGRLHLAPVVLAFLAEHPRVSVRTQFTDQTIGLVESRLQVALRIGELPDSSLHAVPVGRLRRMVVASPDYLEKHGEPRTPSELAAHRAVGFAQDITLARWRFREPQSGEVEYAQPATPLIVNDQYTAVHAAIQGLGLATALSYQVRDALLTGQLRRVLVEYEHAPIPVNLVYVGGDQAAARVRAFVTFAAERLRVNPVLQEELV